MGKKINLIVKEKDKNPRIDVFISNYIKEMSRTRIKNLILGKKLKLNNKIILDPSKKVNFNDKLHQFSSQGNGPISAFVNGMRENFDLQFTLEDFGQNTRSATSKAESSAYVELKINDGKDSIYGCGINTSITVAPILAVLSAINKIKI